MFKMVLDTKRRSIQAAIQISNSGPAILREKRMPHLQGAGCSAIRNNPARLPTRGPMDGQRDFFPGGEGEEVAEPWHTPS